MKKPTKVSPDEAREQFVDWDWIEEREGGMVTKGYVPIDSSGHAIGQSGVTIGAGVDLGQWSESEIVGWGASPALIARLRPYLGLRQGRAIAALDQKALHIGADDATLLSRGSRKRIVADLSSRYEMDAGVAFGSLPAGARTAIASVAFQYGSRLDQRCPRFWRAVTNRRWEAAVAELRAFGDAYPTRRKLEAGILEAAVAASPNLGS